MGIEYKLRFAAAESDRVSGFIDETWREGHGHGGTAVIPRARPPLCNDPATAAVLRGGSTSRHFVRQWGDRHRR